MPLQALRRFLALESSGGLVMMVAAAAAMVIANSNWNGLYHSVFSHSVGIDVGALALSKPLIFWINDGLMAVFFLLVGLEIKREVVEGELSSRERLALPVIGALGGMAVPAAIYAVFNWGDGVALRGWAIPTATDIAFSLAVLSLFGRRVPLALKVFLTAVAIVDDLGAIVVIAVFYTEHLSLGMLGLAIGAVAALGVLNKAGVSRLWPYLLAGVVLWVCVLKSGVHPTLAGVATALAIPFKSGSKHSSPGHRLEQSLHTWVAFGILPLFAFANAGVDLRGLEPGVLLESIPAGIIVGLLVGKTLGIAGASAIAVGSGLAPRPDGATVLTMLGIAALGGIGFTMSLFIGSLAFESHEPQYYALVKLGVVAGSLVSTAVGCALLALGLPRSASKSR